MARLLGVALAAMAITSTSLCADVHGTARNEPYNPYRHLEVKPECHFLSFGVGYGQFPRVWCPGYGVMGATESGPLVRATAIVPLGDSDAPRLAMEAWYAGVFDPRSGLCPLQTDPPDDLEGGEISGRFELPNGFGVEVAVPYGGLMSSRATTGYLTYQVNPEFRPDVGVRFGVGLMNSGHRAGYSFDRGPAAYGSVTCAVSGRGRINFTLSHATRTLHYSVWAMPTPLPDESTDNQTTWSLSYQHGF